MKKISLLCLIATILMLSGCYSENKDVTTTNNNKQEQTAVKTIVVDYSSSKSFAKALNNNEEVDGKIVRFLVKEYDVKSSLGMEIKAGDNLSFITKKDLELVPGDCLFVTINGEPKKENDRWVIDFTLIKIKKNKNVDTSEPEKNDNPDEENLITLPNDSANYIGKNKNDVEKELKNLGFTNIKLLAEKTTEKNNKNDIINSITIDNKELKKDDKYQKDAEIEIKYWQYENNAPKEMILPKENSKLAKDYVEKTEETIYYINVDAVKNIPTLKNWNNVTVTYGLAEYLDYLQYLGFKVTVTKSNVKEPYTGYHFYEVYFKVENENISWTMYLSIQDEKYVEYELDIDLK